MGIPNPEPCPCWVQEKFNKSDTHLRPAYPCPFLPTSSPQSHLTLEVSGPLWLRHGVAGTAYVVLIFHVLVTL